MIPAAVYIFLLIQLIIVSYFDYKVKKISNLWTVVNFAFFILCLFFFPEIYPFHWKMFFIPFVIFIVSFGLFAMRIMGAGDSKYLTSFYLMVPVGNQEDSFFYLTIATIIIGIAIFLINLFRNIDKIINAFKDKNIFIIKEVFGSRFSFAPVVLLAWVIFGWINKAKIF